MEDKELEKQYAAIEGGDGDDIEAGGEEGKDDENEQLRTGVNLVSFTTPLTILNTRIVPRLTIYSIYLHWTVLALLESNNLVSGWGGFELKSTPT